MEYFVHERFFTIQGEGVHLGRRAFFIRLYGCPVKCPWCDSAGTWHPDFKPTHVPRMDEKQLAKEAANTKAEIVVITGGEPSIYDLRPLVAALKANQDPIPRIHLETSGAFPIKGEIDWITLSPKKWKLPLEENIKKAHEFKVIVETPDDLKFYWRVLWEAQFYLNANQPLIWIHPEWGHRKEPELRQAIVRWVLQRGDPFRAGWQLHKLYRADQLDPRSQPPVPLGGDPKKGY